MILVVDFGCLAPCPADLSAKTTKRKRQRLAGDNLTSNKSNERKNHKFSYLGRLPSPYTSGRFTERAKTWTPPLGSWSPPLPLHGGDKSALNTFNQNHVEKQPKTKNKRVTTETKNKTNKKAHVGRHTVSIGASFFFFTVIWLLTNQAPSFRRMIVTEGKLTHQVLTLLRTDVFIERMVSN